MTNYTQIKYIVQKICYTFDINCRGSIFMQHYLSECVTDFLLRQEIIKNEEKDIYVYGTELIISSIINLFICLIISILFKDFINSLIFFISFSSLRRFTGGFHSKSFLRCNIIFAIIVVTTLLLNTYSGYIIDYVIVNVILIIFSLLSIVRFSPVYNDNKKLSEYERKLYLIKSVVVYLIHILVYFLLFIGIGLKLNIIIISDFVVAVMIIWGVLNNGLIHQGRF